MKKLLLASVLCASCYAAPAAASEDARIWAYKYVLATSEQPREFATVLDHLENEPQLRQIDLVDYLAEVLWRISEKTDPANVELKGMLARYLYKDGGPRYLAVFQQMQKANPPQTPARTTANKYVHEYKDTTAEQYIPGTLSLPALRDKFMADALQAQPTEDQALRMAQLPVNADFEALIGKLGRPQYIGSGQLRVGERIIIDVHIQRMTFYYRGLGRVTFQYKGGIGWRARDREVDPEAFEDLMPYRENAALLGLPSDEAVGFAQLLSGHAMAMKYAAESRTLHDGATPEFMDAAAQLLLTNHAGIVEPRMVDAYAWICRLLVTRGGPRYSNVLASAASGATSEKLQKFARLPMEKTAPTTGAPYEPGSVSLTELRAKYPPLYPQRILTSSGWH
jgi:hypothetical protein